METFGGLFFWGLPTFDRLSLTTCNERGGEPHPTRFSLGERYEDVTPMNCVASCVGTDPRVIRSHSIPVFPPQTNVNLT